MGRDVGGQSRANMVAGVQKWRAARLRRVRNYLYEKSWQYPAVTCRVLVASVLVKARVVSVITVISSMVAIRDLCAALSFTNSAFNRNVVTGVRKSWPTAASNFIGSFKNSL